MIGKFILIGLWGLGLSVTNAAEVQGQDQAARVLFVGNSLTYYNNLPEIFDVLAAEMGLNVEVEANIYPGRTLDDVVNDAAAMHQIAEGGWTHVILQPNGMLGSPIFIHGVPRAPVSSPQFAAAARTLLAHVEAAGSTAIVWSPWRPSIAPLTDYELIENAIVDASIHTDEALVIVPVGSAFAAFAPEHRNTLYDADDLHPAAPGSYLAATMLVEEIFELRLFDRARTIEGPELIVDYDVEHHGGPVEVSLGADTVLANIDDEMATMIRNAIEQGRSGWAARRARHIETDPEGAVEPTLGRGIAMSAEDVLGRWVGTASHYPRFLPWPAHMEVTIAQTGSGLVADVMLSFTPEGSSVAVRVIEFRSAVEIGGNILSFTDPNALAGSTVLYSAVMQDDGLSGIAEFDGRTQAIRGIGAWDLQRD